MAMQAVQVWAALAQDGWRPRLENSWASCLVRTGAKQGLRFRLHHLPDGDQGITCHMGIKASSIGEADQG